MFLANLFCFFNHRFRRAHRVLRVQWEENDFRNTLVRQFANSSFDARFRVSHSNFYRHIYDFLKFRFDSFCNENQWRPFIRPNGFIGFCRFLRTRIQNNSLHEQGSKKPAIIDHFFVHQELIQIFSYIFRFCRSWRAEINQ